MHYRHVLLCVLCASAVTSPAADFSNFPPRTTTEETQLATPLATPAAIKELCATLVPPGTGDDTQSRFALSALIRLAGKSEPARQTLESSLADALGQQPDPQIKAYLINQLELIARDASVPALAAYLADEKLCDHAAAALETIATPAATDALLKAIPTSTGPRRLTLTRALGALRATAAADELRKSLATDHPALRKVAAWALANIGDEPTGPALAQALASAQGYDRGQAAANYILWARRLGEAGKADLATQTLRDLAKSEADAGDRNVASAALSTLTDLLGDAALPDLLTAAQHPSIEIRDAALRAAEKLKSPAATEKLLALLPTAPAPTKIDLLASLARRADKSAFPAVAKQTTDPDPTVRTAAADAAVKLDPAAATPLLLTLAQPGDTDDAKSAAALLARIPGDAPLAAITAALPTAPAKGKVLLIDTLASRATPAHKPTLLAQSADTDPAVRAATARAMERLATPDDAKNLLDLALAAPAESEQSAWLRAVVAASAQAAPDQRAAPLLTALPTATGPKRTALLRTLPKVGGQPALDALATHAKSDDKPTRDAALRALGEWPDLAAAPTLLDLARPAETPLAQHVIALRAVVTSVSTAKVPSDQKVKLLADAMATARRPDEKKQVLAALANERHPAALATAATALDDPALQAEAALAVIKIATPADRKSPGLTGPATTAALKKAIPLSPDPKLKEAAEKYLSALEPK